MHVELWELLYLIHILMNCSMNSWILCLCLFIFLCMVSHHQKGGECWNLGFTSSFSSCFDDSKLCGTNGFFEWSIVVTTRVQLSKHQVYFITSVMVIWSSKLILKLTWRHLLKTCEDFWRLCVSVCLLCLSDVLSLQMEKLPTWLLFPNWLPSTFMLTPSLKSYLFDFWL